MADPTGSASQIGHCVVPVTVAVPVTLAVPMTLVVPLTLVVPVIRYAALVISVTRYTSRTSDCRRISGFIRLA